MELVFAASKDVFCVEHLGREERVTAGEVQLVRVYMQRDSGSGTWICILRWLPDESGDSPSTTRQAPLDDLLTVRRTESMLRFTRLGARIFLELRFGSVGLSELLQALSPNHINLIPAADDPNLLYVERVQKGLSDLPSEFLSFIDQSFKKYSTQIQHSVQGAIEQNISQDDADDTQTESESQSDSGKSDKSIHDPNSTPSIDPSSLSNTSSNTIRTQPAATRDLEELSKAGTESVRVSDSLARITLDNASVPEQPSLVEDVKESVMQSAFGISISNQLARVSRSVLNAQREIQGILTELEQHPERILDYKGVDAEAEEERLLMQLEEKRLAKESSSREPARQSKYIDGKLVSDATANGARSVQPRKQDSMGAERVPVSAESWCSSCWSTTGQLVDGGTMRYAIFRGGMKDAEARKVSWPFLLGVFDWDSTAQERAEKRRLLRMTYHSLVKHWSGIFSRAHDENPDSREGFVLDFNSGISNSMSCSNDANEPASNKEGASEHGPTSDVGGYDEEDADKIKHLMEERMRIEKDVLRTDRRVEAFQGDNNPRLAMMLRILMTYALRNMSVGYCQGMSDLLTPLVLVFTQPAPAASFATQTDTDTSLSSDDAEVLAFWCFTALLEGLDANFRDDQIGIHTQLRQISLIMKRADPELAEFFSSSDPQYHCCFRFVLLQFKRELHVEDVMRLWEILWLGYVTPGYLHLYIAVGLLIARRDEILQLPCKFDSVLRFVNGIGNTINVYTAIADGVKLHARTGDAHIEQATNSKENNPSLLSTTDLLPESLHSLLFGSHP